MHNRMNSHTTSSQIGCITSSKSNKSKRQLSISSSGSDHFDSQPKSSKSKPKKIKISDSLLPLPIPPSSIDRCAERQNFIKHAEPVNVPKTVMQRAYAKPKEIPLIICQLDNFRDAFGQIATDLTDFLPTRGIKPLLYDNMVEQILCVTGTSSEFIYIPSLLVDYYYNTRQKVHNKDKARPAKNFTWNNVKLVVAQVYEEAVVHVVNSFPELNERKRKEKVADLMKKFIPNFRTEGNKEKVLLSVVGDTDHASLIMAIHNAESKTIDVCCFEARKMTKEYHDELEASIKQIILICMANDSSTRIKLNAKKRSSMKNSINEDLPMPFLDETDEYKQPDIQVLVHFAGCNFLDLDTNCQIGPECGIFVLCILAYICMHLKKNNMKLSEFLEFIIQQSSAKDNIESVCGAFFKKIQFLPKGITTSFINVAGRIILFCLAKTGQFIPSIPGSIREKVGHEVIEAYERMTIFVFETIFNRLTVNPTTLRNWIKDLQIPELDQMETRDQLQIPENLALFLRIPYRPTEKIQPLTDNENLRISKLYVQFFLALVADDIQSCNRCNRDSNCTFNTTVELKNITRYNSYKDLEDPVIRKKRLGYPSSGYNLRSNKQAHIRNILVFPYCINGILSIILQYAAHLDSPSDLTTKYCNKLLLITTNTNEKDNNSQIEELIVSTDFNNSIEKAQLQNYESLIVPMNKDLKEREQIKDAIIRVLHTYHFLVNVWNPEVPCQKKNKNQERTLKIYLLVPKVDWIRRLFDKKNLADWMFRFSGFTLLSLIDDQMNRHLNTYSFVESKLQKDENDIISEYYEKKTNITESPLKGKGNIVTASDKYLDMSFIQNLEHVKVYPLSKPEAFTFFEKLTSSLKTKPTENCDYYFVETSDATKKMVPQRACMKVVDNPVKSSGRIQNSGCKNCWRVKL